MDTGTVISVIGIIDSNIRFYENLVNTSDDSDISGYLAAISALSNLSDYLQEYIEGQLNAFENQTGE